VSATLATIDAALYAALTPLLATSEPTDALPFACVARFVGDMSRDALQQFGAQSPACLLRFDGESDTRDIDVVSGGSEEKGAAQWTVFVVVEDPRSPDDTVQGATGVPGALTLAGKALSACNALAVTGLWRGRRVRYVDARPALVAPGASYVLALRFEAIRVVEQATTTQPSVPLTNARGNVNLIGTADPAPNPLDTFNASTT